MALPAFYFFRSSCFYWMEKNKPVWYSLCNIFEYGNHTMKPYIQIFSKPINKQLNLKRQEAPWASRMSVCRLMTWCGFRPTHIGELNRIRERSTHHASILPSLLRVYKSK